MNDTSSADSRPFFSQDSRVARLARQLDWASTPLGSPEQWPPPLKTIANLVLGSALPMNVAWGQEFTQIYNDGYLPFLGDKHPDALGAPVRETWSEIWELLSQQFEVVMSERRAIWKEDQLMLLNRRGFLQESYFTFSYSPVFDDGGEAVGVLAAAVETTDSVLEQRRTSLLRCVAGLPERSSLDRLFQEVVGCLADAERDLPAVALYRVHEPERTLGLVADHGLPPESLPPTDQLEANLDWSTLRAEAVLHPVDGCFTEVESVDDGRPGISSVALLPIHESPDDGRCVAMLMVGMSEHLPDDARYLGFLEELGVTLGRKVDDIRLHELHVAEAENRYRAIFEYSTDGILLTAPDGPILAANPAVCRMFGYTEDEFTALGRADVVAPDDPRLADFLETRRRTGQAQAELTLIRNGGERFQAEITSNIYRDAEGNERTSMIVRDIEDRLELEHQLRHAQKMEAVGKLAGGIAHDFNNLLTVIDGQAQFLDLQLDAGSGLGEDVELIREACERARALTRRLLAFSRRQASRPDALDIGATIDGFDAMLRRLIGADVELVTVVDPDCPSVYADRDGIEQILLNLAVNARDAMPDGGELSIEVTSAELTPDDLRPDDHLPGPGRYVRMRVTDTGDGIPADVLPRIFEPFFSTKSEGTGLGLATVDNIVEELDGGLRVDSEPGRGTSIEVFFPLADRRSEPEEDEQVSTLEFAPQTRVLLVEDQPTVRRVTVRMLERAGLEVTAAGNADEALEYFAPDEPAPFDMVISDLVMPRMSGERLVGQLQSSHPELEFLLISGYPDSRQLDAIREHGFELLMKPFSSDELLEAVYAILDS